MYLYKVYFVLTLSAEWSQLFPQKKLFEMGTIRFYRVHSKLIVFEIVCESGKWLGRGLLGFLQGDLALEVIGKGGGGYLNYECIA